MDLAAPLSGLRVLVVEDEPIIAMGWEMLLRKRGCQPVGIAPSVDAALTLLRTVPVDVAILDMRLQGGETAGPVAQALRERGVPFVLSSGWADAAWDEAFRAGVPLGKPFTDRAAEQALRQAAEKIDTAQRA